jgi:hypothetical protein
MPQQCQREKGFMAKIVVSRRDCNFLNFFAIFTQSQRWLYSNPQTEDNQLTVLPTTPQPLAIKFYM